MTDEIWVNIKGYATLYQVSSHGRVRINLLHSSVSQGILKLHKSSGYMTVYLSICQCGKQFSVHRLVAENFLPKPLPEQIYVNHINGVKTDNRLQNLEWVTPSENSKHSVRTGLTPKKIKKVPDPDVEAAKLAIKQRAKFLASQC